MDSLMSALQPLISRHDLSEEELKTLNNLKEMLDKMYVNLAKGVFITSRAKWLEDGEKNSSYFFAQEKRNWKRNNITSLSISGVISSDVNIISNYIIIYIIL